MVRYQTGRMWKPAVVINKHSSPQSYNIRTPQGTVLRRNRYHLIRTKETFTLYDDTDDYFDDDFTGDLADSQSSNEAP